MLCIRWRSRRRRVRSGCARSWPIWSIVRQFWFSTLAARSAVFTGDGIMAVFGAPAALEDHGIRACMAALGVQEEAKRLASYVRERDGVELQLRVGLNSGQVIAGEIGSGPFGYTTIGEQVGMAQRMESAAPPGGVMLSESTARLVDHAATLGEPELVQIKGADEPVSGHRLLGIGEEHRAVGPVESIWWVDGGRCPPLKACWSVQSTGTALWSVWWVRLVLAKAVWCVKFRRWRLPVASRFSPRTANLTRPTFPSTSWRGCCVLRPP